MSLRDSLMDGLLKSVNVLHRGILKVSGGRLRNSPLGMPTVELHTVGRKSGKDHSILLTTPIHDANRVVLIASKGGDDRHPHWYLNLVANPDVDVTIGGVRKAMRARTASPDEKAELWPRVVDAYKGYAGYQRRTDRDIPVVICETR